jgi:hypothetical protein
MIHSTFTRKHSNFLPSIQHKSTIDMHIYFLASTRILTTYMHTLIDHMHALTTPRHRTTVPPFYCIAVMRASAPAWIRIKKHTHTHTHTQVFQLKLQNFEDPHEFVSNYGIISTHTHTHACIHAYIHTFYVQCSVDPCDFVSQPGERTAPYAYWNGQTPVKRNIQKWSNMTLDGVVKYDIGQSGQMTSCHHCHGQK